LEKQDELEKQAIKVKAVMDRWGDPIKKLEEEFNGVFKLFSIGAIGKKEFERATKEIKHELMELQAKAEVHVSMTGLHSLEADSEEAFKVMQDTINGMQAEKKAIMELDRLKQEAARNDPELKEFEKIHGAVGPLHAREMDKKIVSNKGLELTQEAMEKKSFEENPTKELVTRLDELIKVNESMFEIEKDLENVTPIILSPAGFN
jgi:hypothetical protein